MSRLTAGAGAVAVLLLAACGGTTGMGAAGTGPVTTGTATTTGAGTITVTGRFLIEGGPMRPGGGQPGERPLRGTVTFTTVGGRRVSVHVGRSGAFSVALAPGTYHVAGRSPEIMEVSSGGAQHETVCSRPLMVHVTGQHALKVAVTCIVP